MSSTIPPGVDLCSIPAGKPPAGVVPNLVDPVNLSVETLAVGSVLTALSLIFLAGRLRANWNRMKLADYFSIAGFVLRTGYTGIIMGMHQYTRHAWDMPACWYMADHIWKMLFAQNFILGPTQIVVKVAILALYLQIFAVERKFRLAIWAGIVACCFIYLPHTILVAIFNAPHIGQRWADLATNGMPQKLVFYAPIHGIGAIIIDIYIFIIPLLVLRKLRVSSKKRLQLLVVFLTALFGVISSCFSCYWRITITFSSGDYTWQESQLFIWCIVEQDMAVVVGCMPAFAAFIRSQTIMSTMRSKLLGSHGASNKPGSYTPAGAAMGHDRDGRVAHYEMHDSLLDTKMTRETILPLEKYPSLREGDILRTTDISQESSPYRAV
ncbi:hypothetical protein HIM_11062 [Hirsutella minnesotensis 3608]|uniref:Rhodopsin domain-containing protein n=1 Tax=Hirsutella minnesotensis 3608 TaxID=1043627 RepID=A0A0F8A1M5_9HYPO|nr:hypothetical protein HIM_11062 [Hirsutella minnesotensis 3608]